MTISPPSDIILEVARAADPTKLAAATERLRDIAQARGRDTDGFGAAVAEVSAPPAAPAPPLPPFDAERARVRLANLETIGVPPPRPIGIGPDLPAAERPAPRPAPAQDSPAVQFEAQLLGQVVETLMPDAPALYGDGSAGSIWKGFLAQEIGAELARAGGIGVAQAVAAAHPELDQVNAAKATLWPEHASQAAAQDARAGYFTGFYRI